MRLREADVGSGSARAPSVERQEKPAVEAARSERSLRVLVHDFAGHPFPESI